MASVVPHAAAKAQPRSTMTRAERIHEQARRMAEAAERRRLAGEEQLTPIEEVRAEYGIPARD